MNQRHQGTASREPVTQRIVRRIATEERVDETELDPLYGAVDGDALESLLASGFDGVVSFTYHGYCVTVEGEGAVSVDSQTHRSPETSL